MKLIVAAIPLLITVFVGAYTVLNLIYGYYNRAWCLLGLILFVALYFATVKIWDYLT